MIIGGFQKLTLLDYPGHLAAIVFTAGCNLRCSHCYNFDLVLPKKIKKGEKITESEVLKILHERSKFLEGLVISGGEPTLQPDLAHFIEEVRKLGYKVKLDTNGLRPDVVKKLLKEKFLDYIAMDIKASKEKYSMVGGMPVDLDALEESIELIMNSGVDYEFRSTILPKYHDKEEIIKMAKLIRGANAYFLQGFISKKTLDPDMENSESYRRKALETLAETAAPYVKRIEVRI